MPDITAKYPEYSGYEIHKQWILAVGWSSQDELSIREDVIYRNVKDYLSVNLTYVIKNKKLSLVKQVIAKKQRE